MDMRGLTPEEVEVAKLAGRVYLAFKELPQAHPSDLGEVAIHVHAIGADRLRACGSPRAPRALDVQVVRAASACSASRGHSAA